MKPDLLFLSFKPHRTHILSTITRVELNVGEQFTGYDHLHFQFITFILYTRGRIKDIAGVGNVPFDDAYFPSDDFAGMEPRFKLGNESKMLQVGILFILDAFLHVKEALDTMVPGMGPGNNHLVARIIIDTA